MLSIMGSSKIGKFYADIYFNKNFTTLDIEFKAFAKKTEFREINGFDATTYVIKTNIFSRPTESIIVIHKAEYVTSIALETKNGDEYNKIITYIRQFPQKFLLKKLQGTFKSYDLVGTDFMLEIARDDQKDYLCVRRKILGD